MLELGQRTIDKERAKIVRKLEHFEFPDGQSLKEHTPETGRFDHISLGKVR